MPGNEAPAAEAVCMPVKAKTKAINRVNAGIFFAAFIIDSTVMRPHPPALYFSLFYYSSLFHPNKKIRPAYFPAGLAFLFSAGIIKG
jgi:hypothetical protein